MVYGGTPPSIHSVLLPSGRADVNLLLSEWGLRIHTKGRNKPLEIYCPFFHPPKKTDSEKRKSFKLILCKEALLKPDK
jgi:hypothetical protein